MLARDKALSKELLAFHRIRVPRHAVFPFGRKAKRPRKLAFPLVVKSLVEEASLGIAQASLVTSDEKLEERVLVKWDLDYQKKYHIDTQAADLPSGAAEHINKLCTRIYRVLKMSGYARIDLRLAADGLSTCSKQTRIPIYKKPKISRKAPSPKASNIRFSSSA